MFRAVGLAALVLGAFALLASSQPQGGRPQYQHPATHPVSGGAGGGQGVQAPPPLNQQQAAAAAAAAAAAHHNVESVDPNELHLADDSPAMAHQHHSLEGPFSPNVPLPFWDDGASAKVAERYVRLTEDRQSRTGFLWNNVPSTMTDWEVTFEFSVSGRPMLGGDGFAFWYTDRPGLLGPVYGASDYWTGLLIAFDTFNNDGQGRNPLITAHNNDGTRTYEHAWDGEHGALASCTSNFRNRPQTSFARVTYQSHALTLDLGLDRGADGNPIWERCFSINEVELGVDKYFGFTAHTGDVADNHDVYAIRTRDLSPTSDPAALDKVRQHYKDEQHDPAHHPEYHEQPPAEFQHNVLNLLHQIQSATNMLETTTIAIGDLLTSQQAVKELEAAHEESEEDDESEDDGEPDPPGTVHPTAHDAKKKHHKTAHPKDPVVTAGTPQQPAAAAATHTPHHPEAQKNHKESMHSQTRILEQLTRVAETQASLASSVTSLTQALDAKIAASLKTALEHEITAFRVQEHQYFQEALAPVRDDFRRLQSFLQSQSNPGASAGYPVGSGSANGASGGSSVWFWVFVGMGAVSVLLVSLYTCFGRSSNSHNSRWPKSHI